jgi:magnesium-protoporphyrin O-methyltransferase
VTCTQCSGIERTFDRAEAAKKLRQFRRRGPDRSTRVLLRVLRAALDEVDARDATLLDIGAGIGAIHHELLDGRIAHATHVDASTAHVAVAREEATRRGHDARVEFILGDFVTLAGDLPSADVVTLDRVICCYPDMLALTQRSARKASRFYGAVYPRSGTVMRIAIAAVNVVQRIRRSQFRVFHHDPAAIHAVLEREGFERRALQRTLGWEVALFARTPPGPDAAGR